VVEVLKAVLVGDSIGNKASAANAFSVSFSRLAYEVSTCGLPVMPLQCLGFGVLKFALDVVGYR
jgi:hypothetical protein